MKIAWYWLLELHIAAVVAIPCRAQLMPAEEERRSKLAQPVGGQPCDPSLIDTKFTFANLPVGEQTVSLHFENKGPAPCKLEGRVAPSFAVDSHSMYVDICWLCRDDGTGSPAPQREDANQILLAPGEWATVDEYWSSTGGSCQWADWVNFGAEWPRGAGFLFIPSEWPLHICSAAKSSGYRAGKTSAAGGAVREQALRVSVTPSVIYTDEAATLHVELVGQPPSTSGCGSLYSVLQRPGDATRLDPLHVTGKRVIASYTPAQLEEDKFRTWPGWKRNLLRRCDIEPGETSVNAGIDARDLANLKHIEWRTAEAPGSESAFLVADTHFTVLDLNTLAPNWGETVDGIHTGLSVDRDTFTIGEWIPLHIRWDNLAATKTLGQEECGEPEPALEIQDSQHHVLQTVPLVEGCNGHGWGPMKIKQNQEQRRFWQIGTETGTQARYAVPEATKLTTPGVYYLVAIWSPLVLEPNPPTNTDNAMRMSDGQLGRVYATARSMPVKIEIRAKASP